MKWVLGDARQLHEVCAAMGRAPQLLGFDVIPGGWIIVAMEYVEGEILSIKKKYSQTWAENLRENVEAFHNQGLVHGDLKDNNIIIPIADDTKPIIIDFDWGGEAKKVFYSISFLHPDNRMEGERTLAITTRDDDRAVQLALDRYKE